MVPYGYLIDAVKSLWGATNNIAGRKARSDDQWPSQT